MSVGPRLPAQPPQSRGHGGIPTLRPPHLSFRGSRGSPTMVSSVGHLEMWPIFTV